MKVSQKIALAALLLLLVAAVAGVFFTRDSSRATPRQQQSGPASGQAPLVDEQPLRTARSLAPLAATAEEQTLAKETLHIADHDVDLAFAIAMRQATENPPPPTPETREIVKRLQDAKKTVAEEQQEVANLTNQLAGASGARKEKLQADIDEV